ncbi:MAG: hypothetical protein IPK18_05860 [Sphingobacteriales bacterium]|jgi:hypothetical protein|nr:MAG: hypothetical protein IPK18_05860 [Sphingobacteriales bacterium]
MNKLLFFLISAMLFLSSCKKEEVKQKNTRLKTYSFLGMAYTITYNSFNKIDNLKVVNGTNISYTYCRYKADHSLDSIILFNVDGNVYRSIDVDCSNFRITKYDDNVITYNSNGNINTITNFYYYYGDLHYQYSGDSLMIYNSSDILIDKYQISTSIKNPFYITGFEAERFVLYYLLDYASPLSSALLPYAETKKYLESVYTNYTYEGNFNGYPLKRYLGTNTEYVETFTYEEF